MTDYDPLLIGGEDNNLRCQNLAPNILHQTQGSNHTTVYLLEVPIRFPWGLWHRIVFNFDLKKNMYIRKFQFVNHDCANQRIQSVRSRWKWNIGKRNLCILHHVTVGSPTPVPRREFPSYIIVTHSVQVSQELYTHFGIYHITSSMDQQWTWSLTAEIKQGLGTTISSHYYN